MRSLILICGSAVLSVRFVSDLIPGTGRKWRHRKPLTVAPSAETGLVATLTPRIPRSTSVRTPDDGSFDDPLSSETRRGKCGDADQQSELVPGLNRSSGRRVSFWSPSQAMARIQVAQQRLHGIILPLLRT